jgi:hypothetical protein
MVVGFIIRALKEDPLPTGMFDMFLKKIKLFVSLWSRISKRHKRCIREEKYESNNRLRAKQIIEYSLLLSYY